MSVAKQEHGIWNPYTDDQITEALMAVVAWAGNVSAACRTLRAKKWTITNDTLGTWVKETHSDRYHDLREKYSERLEAQLVHEYRDIARFSVEVQRLGLERAQQRLLSDKDNDPSRTAANAARVAQSMTDKMLSLSGRPTSIREDRNIEEILRSLVAKKILSLPEGEVTDAEVAETPVPEVPDVTGASDVAT